MLRFNILGSLEIIQNGRSITPSPPKVRCVLALLVVRANQIVHPDSLIAELWGGTPPKSAMTTLQTYVYHLRRMFAEQGLCPGGEELLVTRAPGYVLRMPKDALDSEVFEQLAAEGQSHLERGCAAQAAPLLREALAMWSGPVLSNVTRGTALEGHTVLLEERRIHTLQLRIQADLEMGRHREIVGELRSLTAAYPLDEWFSSRLITTLVHSGRRSEALNAYHRVRTQLRDELGLDPSPDLERTLHAALA